MAKANMSLSLVMSYDDSSSDEQLMDAASAAEDNFFNLDKNGNKSEMEEVIKNAEKVVIPNPPVQGITQLQDHFDLINAGKFSFFMSFF